MKTSSPNQIVHYAKCLFAQYKWALAVLLFATFASVQAQQITGIYCGDGRTRQSAVIGTATVKATNVDTGFTRSTPANSDGDYRIDYLPVGRYTVEVTGSVLNTSSKEYLPQRRPDADCDVTLTVGAQTETVTVNEAPPLINTSDAVLGRTLEPDEIIGLPLVNRNVYSEISLVPGVMANNQSPTSNPTGAPNRPLELRPLLFRSMAGSTPATGPSPFIWMAATTSPGCATTATRRPTPTHRRVRRRDQRILGAIRPILRRCRLGDHKVGNKFVHGSLFEFNRNTDFNAWLGSGRTVKAAQGEGALPPQPIWRNLRRPR